MGVERGPWTKEMVPEGAGGLVFNRLKMVETRHRVSQGGSERGTGGYGACTGSR